MRNRLIVMMGLVAFGITRQITAQQEPDGFIGITSANGTRVGIYRVPKGALIPLDNVLRIEVDLNIIGWRNIQGCVAGQTPPNCTYTFNRPPTGHQCDNRTDRLTDYYQGSCDLLGNGFTINWWMSAPDGTWNNPVHLPNVTYIKPQLIDPLHCVYYALTSAKLALPACLPTTTPTPSPTPTPVMSCPPDYTPVPCPSPPPGYTPVPWTCCPDTAQTCAWGYFPTCGCYAIVCCNQYSCTDESGKPVHPAWVVPFKP